MFDVRGFRLRQDYGATSDVSCEVARRRFASEGNHDFSSRSYSSCGPIQNQYSTPSCRTSEGNIYPKSLSNSLCVPIHAHSIVSPVRLPTARMSRLTLTDQ